MKSTYELYDLIAKMDKSERGYFKKYAYKGGQKENEYLKLYEYVVKNVQKYDMDVLEEKCKKKFGQTKSFASIKNYLFDLIIQVLVEYHKPQKPLGELFYQLQKSLVLHKKGMLSKAAKILETSVEKGIQKEEFDMVLRLASYLPAWYITLDTPEKIKPLLEKKNIELAKLNQSIQLDDIKHLFYLFCNAGYIRTDEKRAAVDAVLDTMPEAEALLSTKAKYTFQEIHSMDAWMRGDFMKTFYTCLEKVKIYENNEHWEASVHALSREYRGLIQSAINANEFELSKTYIDKMDTLKGDVYFEYYKTTSLIYLKLKLYQRRNELEKCNEVMKNAQEYFEQKGVNLDTFVIGAIYSAILQSLLLEKYNQMLYWINLYDKELGKIVEMQFKMETRLMSIIAHYELGNFDLLPYQIRNLKRVFDKKKEDFVYENIILKQLTKALKTKTNGELTMVYIETKEMLLSKEDTIGFKHFRNAFDIISWLTAKIENRSFREVWYEKMLTEKNK